MPTNPGNIVRIRSRNGGRASVYESNMWAQKFSGGLFSGSGVRQNTSADMNILVGGSSNNPDVVIGQNAAGYNIAIDIVGTQAIAITKPASNSRITAIVAYTNDLSLTSADAGTTGSPSSCGLIVVNGASSASPVAPSDSDIRAAITADGATGSQATYCVIATILVASTTTNITNTLISTRKAQLPTGAISDGAITSDKVDFTTFVTKRLNTTVTTIGGLKIAVGANIISNGTSAAVSYGTTFTNTPIVLITNAQGNGSSNAFAYPAVAATAFNDRIWSVSLQTLTGFTAQISGASVPSTGSALFTWIAIGN